MRRYTQALKHTGQEHRQALVSLITQATHSHSTWQIWDDLIYISAAALSQPLMWVQERENEYMRRIGRYDKQTQELFPKMFAEIVLAFEQEGCTDILGDLYMKLRLFNKWKSQYFTPSYVCELMVNLTSTDLSAVVEKQGYITVNDSCCGGGALLIAFAKNATEMKINYQTDVLFVGQDIDPVVARMCYISMALLGMPGYVIIGNTLTMQCSEVIYTPMYFIRGFQWRKQRKPSHAFSEALNDNEPLPTDDVAYMRKEGHSIQKKDKAFRTVMSYSEDTSGQITIFL